MSLLLEALKMAERATEEAQRRAEGAALPAQSAPPRPTPSETAAVQAALTAEPAVLTRDQLPDIRQPLTLEGDEQAAQPPPAAAPRENRPPREAVPAARPAA